MVNEILNPISLVIPSYTTANRILMKAEVGTLVFDTTLGVAYICSSSIVGSGAWKDLD